ncbi:MAG TPA: hypothetical protein VK463_01940 [Desulfomonilaceae bacterium]|nr:hypothetical protein [Desulfomonilaceae bacterium]
MRSISIALVSICLAAALVGNSYAVGLYVVGKEDCDCSPLVARGIVPDTLNKMKEAFLFPQIAEVLDRIGIEVKAMLAGLGPAPAEAAETPAITEQTEGKAKTEMEKAPAKEEKPAVEKPAKHKKPTAELKKVEKKKTKKKVKMPPRAM